MPTITTNNGVRFYAGAPDETFSVDGAIPAVIYAAAGDTITADGTGGEAVFGAPGVTISTGAGQPPLPVYPNGAKVYAQPGNAFVPMPTGITVYPDVGDTINTGSGGASIQDAGNDVVNGGSGPDLIAAASGDTINTGSGADTILFNAGTLTLHTQSPNPATLYLPVTAAQATETFASFADATVTAPGISIAITGNDATSTGFQFLDGSVGTVNDTVVDHLYLLLLGRSPDPIGYGFWVGQIDSGQATPDQVAAAITTSTEFQANAAGRSVAQVVQQNVLALPRTDPAGAGSVSSLTDELNSGEPPTQVAQAYRLVTLLNTNDQLYAPNQAAIDVTSLYEALLHRAPDGPGFAFWVGQEQAGATAAQIAQGFIGSQEFAAALAAQPATNTGFAATVIKEAYGGADPAAAAAWGQALDSGSFTQAGVALAYARSQSILNEVNAVLSAKLPI